MPLTLSDLPPALLQGVLRSLSPEDLAGLAVQCAYLRSQADEKDLWQAHSLARWPGADAAAVSSYGGSWAGLYKTRSSLPDGFPLGVDRVRQLTAHVREREAAGPRDALPRSAVEDLMRSLNAVRGAATADARVARCREFAALKRDVAWWLEHRPDAMVAFARAAGETLRSSFDMWTAPHGVWAEAAWRRDALAALSTLGLLTKAHPSVAGRLRGEAAALNRAVAAAQSEEEGGSGSSPVWRA